MKSRGKWWILKRKLEGSEWLHQNSHFLPTHLMWNGLSCGEKALVTGLFRQRQIKGA
jgi:hypothetical protein